MYVYGFILGTLLCACAGAGEQQIKEVDVETQADASDVSSAETDLDASDLPPSDGASCTEVVGYALDLSSGCRTGPVEIGCVVLDEVYPRNGHECRVAADGTIFVSVSVSDEVPLEGFSLCPSEIDRLMDCRE